jgi:hypothetical protein
MRLDDDGMLHEPVRADLFGVMDRFGYVYGLRKVHSGYHDDVVESLSAFALDYVHRHQVGLGSCAE